MIFIGKMMMNFGGKMSSVLADKIAYSVDECVKTNCTGYVNWHKVTAGFR